MSGDAAILDRRQTVTCGALWGVAVAVVSTITQPLFGLPLGDVARFLGALLLQWCLAGILLSLGALHCRGRWSRARAAILLIVVFGFAFAVQWMFSRMAANAAGADADTVTGAAPITDLAVYIAWITLFFGGLYLAGFFAMRRTLGMRRRFATFRLARDEADALLREGRVSACRGQLQPDMLLASLNALRERYDLDRVEGDRLFDALIAFLRAAMPSVRSGLSTLAAEFATLRHYGTLRRSLRSPGASWRLVGDDLALPALPFPPLLLLPALDVISRTLPSEATLELAVAVSADAVTVRLAASHRAAFPAPFDQRLRAGLAMCFAGTARLSEGCDLPFILHLPLPAGACDSRR